MASEFADRVAKRIKELREARGFSLRELARRSGLSPESVSRSERAVTEITLTSLERLCGGLEVSMPEFFDFATRASSLDIGDGLSARVLGLLKRVPAGRRVQVVKALESLLNSETGASRPVARRAALRRPPKH